MTEYTEAIRKIQEQLNHQAWLKTPKLIHANGGKVEKWLNDGSVEIYRKNWRGKYKLAEVINNGKETN